MNALDDLSALQELMYSDSIMVAAINIYIHYIHRVC